MQFHSPTKGLMSLKEVTKDILSYLKEDQQGKYNLIIGTDSHGVKEANFVTAIIIHHLGKGGRYFWKKSKKIKVNSLRHKVWQEVTFSLDLAQRLIQDLKDFIIKEKSPFYENLEIHIDVGENGPTREMIKEVVAAVNGNGFKAKVKPEAYGASITADRHTS
jgi:hypothetical protein